MTKVAAVHQGETIAYGAEELKRVAHAHGIVALAISVSIHCTILASYYVIVKLEGGQLAENEDRGKWSVMIVDAPPWIPGFYEPSQPQPSATTYAVRKIGVPIPVPDLNVSPERTLSTQTEMAGRVDPHGQTLGEAGTRIGVRAIEIEEAPPESFRIVEREPVIVKRMEPVYPPLALRADLEGRVWVKTRVDRQGLPKQVVVMKSDNDIFNEAAVEAARQFVFMPAYMNNCPVSVWVSVPFSFRIAKK